MRSIPKEADRCEFVSTDGRRCCMIRVAPDVVFCFNHWRRQQQEEQAARIGEEIVAADDPLNTQESIHKALGNVFRFCARDLISPRSAAVLGYVGQLMLVSLPSIERTIKSLLPALQLAMKMGHQADKSKSNSDERLYKMTLDEFEVIKRLIEQFSSFNTMSDEDRQRFAKFAATFLSKKEGEPGAKSSS
ncbi:MAG: hypothetical protein HY234_00425 [Acidobacteria bacterium]|nr:hypothetical protein [Acidobacteriota bacterium]MBI3661506.1 hypothetical protein [Acidobacteriota bacterium]